MGFCGATWPRGKIIPRGIPVSNLVAQERGKEKKER